MSRRIALCGASGTGKTTLARWVADTYGLPLNPVGSRSVAAAMGFESPYDVDRAGKRGEFQRRLQAEKVRWELEHDAFVTDRTTLDELAYTWAHDHATAIERDYFDRAHAHMSRYTLVVRCPVDVFCSLDDDPKRLNDMRYQRAFDAHLHGLLIDCPQTDASWFDLLDGGLDARKVVLRDVIGGM